MPPARIFLKALQILALGCATAALAAQGGRWSAHLDVLTHFAPIYLAVSVVVLMTAMILRGGSDQFILAVLGGLAAISSMVLVLPEFLRPTSPRAAPGAPGQIKVIQFNGNGMPGGAEQAIDWIGQQNPDIVVIVQGTPRLLRGIRERVPLTLICGLSCEVAILGRAKTSQPFNAPPGTPKALALYDYTDSQGGFLVAGAHHTWPTRTSLHAQNSKGLVRAVSKGDSERLILAGDFNSTPWSFARQREDAALGIERRTRGMFTWPSHGLPGFPILPIDHIYAGPGWRTVEVTRGPDLGSDHYPVVAILAPKR